MAVFEKVQEIIVEELGKIEDAFDIQIEAEDDLKTVGDLVAYVEEQTK